MPAFSGAKQGEPQLCLSFSIDKRDDHIARDELGVSARNYRIVATQNSDEITLVGEVHLAYEAACSG